MLRKRELGCGGWADGGNHAQLYGKRAACVCVEAARGAAFALVTMTAGRTVLTGGTATSDTYTGQYGGQLSWTMPGKLKFSTLSAQGSYNPKPRPCCNARYGHDSVARIVDIDLGTQAYV